MLPLLADTCHPFKADFFDFNVKFKKVNVNRKFYNLMRGISKLDLKIKVKTKTLSCDDRMMARSKFFS